MQVWYYVILNNKSRDRLDFQGDEGVQRFFVLHPEAEGVIYLKDAPGLKIAYNTQTGVVALHHAEQKPWITHVFSSDAFQSNLIPITVAIRRLAKLDLLARLFKLNDADICQLIQKNHVVDKESGKIQTCTEEAINKTLSHIRSIVVPNRTAVGLLFRIFSGGNNNDAKQTPMQKSIYEAFESYQLYSEGLDQIKSGRDVVGVMSKILEIYELAQRFSPKS